VVVGGEVAGVLGFLQVSYEVLQVGSCFAEEKMRVGRLDRREVQSAKWK
jgi:hypothetical protein